MGRYERTAVTKLAIQLLDSGEREIRETMRTQFPGLTNWMLREALADARLIIAFRKIGNEGD
jgi:hypothetical protein